MTDTIFNSSETSDSSPSKGAKPLFTAFNENIAGWLKQDKNSNYFISVKLPLDLGNFNLYPVSEAEGLQTAFNQFGKHVEREVLE
jgi:hypothetical protein